MAEDIFEGLPPPSAASALQDADRAPSPIKKDPPARTPAPVLKSALKRDKPSEVQQDGPAAAVPQKRIKFKTTIDASETQVIEAMQKIASHIKNPSKFGKASKLAMQLVQAGSVNAVTSDHFFAILEAAMSSPSGCTDPSLRADYQALFSAAQDVAEVRHLSTKLLLAQILHLDLTIRLFSAAQDVAECFNRHQKYQLATWTLHAVVANDLYTDDSFVFSKVAGRIKDAISSLPVATEEDDRDEAAALSEDEAETLSSDDSAQYDRQEESDPFGLDSLLTSELNKYEKSKRRKDVANANMKAQGGENKQFLKSQREALILCLEIAARRYKLPWAQTVIDILAKHAFDNIQRFTSQQRNAIEKLWASIREQHTRRKQGKSVTGKLDMNAFEFLQEKYANEKISIRHAVGGGGDRRAEQWLG